MLDKLIATLAVFITSVISSAGYVGVALMMAVESACIPLPSEIIMPFSGYLVFTGRFSLFWVATAGAIGCNLGSVLAYEVGYHGGRPLVERFGSYILLNKRDLDWADRFFTRHGEWAIIAGRLLPVVRTFIALPAGIARMPRLRFHLYTFFASWIWCLALAYVGFRLGEKWNSDPRLKAAFHRFDAVIVAVILVGIGWFVWSHWKHRVRAA